ncbi:MAG: ATP-binding protein [Pseudomonadota bacterium]
MSWHKPDQDNTPAAAASRLMPGLSTHVQDGVVLLDKKDRITEINAQALTLLHLSLPGLAGRDLWEVLPDELTEKYQSATRKAIDASAQHTFVVYSEFEDSRLEYAFRQHTSGCILNIRDVSATHKLQSQLEDNQRYTQLIFAVNPIAMWLFDRVSLRILAVNRAAVEFYGYSRKQFLKLQMGGLFPDGEGVALLSSLGPDKGPEGNQPAPQICKQKKSDGQLVLVELACGYVSWNGNQTVLVSISDVTDRHLADRTLRRENQEMEQRLAELRDELNHTNRDLAAFTHALSNDLQAPLHATNGFAAMLAEKYAAVLDAPGRHYVNRIQASTRQLAKLVDDLRTLVQLPQLSAQPECFDLVPVCRALVEDLRQRSADKDKPLSLEVAPSLMLTGDRNLLVTALGCLLENAWKFSSKKAERWIRLELLPGENLDEVVLRVSDNGAGFDAVYGGKLFTAFQRLHSSADFPGHGLGLAIVKRVAQRHGGRVWAESSDQAGASFFMALPQLLPKPAHT